jgi:eukaryotic-like serine/threonine-protein kinase
VKEFDTWFEKLRAAPAEQRTADLQRIFHGDPQLHAQLRQRLSSDDLADEPRPAIAGYRIVEALGSGGMSMVWIAERTDGVLNRRVALKLPLPRIGASVDMKRFERERDILAKFEHRNIARLYDAGFTTDGRPFIALEHVHGAPITEYIATRANWRSPIGSACSCRCWRRSSSRTRTSSCIATSSHRTCSSTNRGR